MTRPKLIKRLYVFFFVKYYEECHGVIYVIDSSDERRLEESQVTFGEYKLLTVLILNKTPRVYLVPLVLVSIIIFFLFNFNLHRLPRLPRQPSF